MSHAKRLLYRSDGSPRALHQLDVPSGVEVLNFKRGIHPGPTVIRLRIDATSPPDSAWNIRACQIFARSFFTMQHPDAGGKTFMDASHEFYRLIPTFISRHATGSGFADSKGYERFQELTAKPIRKHRVSRISGIASLAYCILQLAESRLQTVYEVQRLRKFLPIIRRLVEEDGMSSDEMDTSDDCNFQCTRPFWRHSSITNWLHGIDSIGAENMKYSFQHEYMRRPSSTVDMESRVVKGLPINFYDQDYLNGLDRSNYLGLDARPAVSLDLHHHVSS